MTTTQPCFSNPETLEIFLKEMDAKVRSLPNEKWFSVCIEDNEVCCDCERCKQPIKLPNGRMLQLGDPAFYSTHYYMFLNEVARYLKKNFPGRGISTYAYLFTEIAPAVPIEDNIRIICTAPFKDIKYPVYAPQNDYSFTRLKSWLDYGNPSGIVLYDYHGLSNDYPRPAGHTHKPSGFAVCRRLCGFCLLVRLGQPPRPKPAKHTPANKVADCTYAVYAADSLFLTCPE